METSADTTKTWSICLCERPVKRGARLNKLVLGRPLGHVFLAMMTSDGTVAGEIHAGAWEGGERRKLNLRSRISEHAFALASLANVESPLRQAFNMAGLKTDLQLTFHASLGPEQIKSANNLGRLVEGPREEVGALWKRLMDEAYAFNQKHVPYNRFGHNGDLQNCQTAIVWLLDEMDIKIPPVNFGYAVPGWRRLGTKQGGSAPK